MAAPIQPPLLVSTVQNIVCNRTNVANELVVAPEDLTALFDKNTPFAKAEKLAGAVIDQSSPKRFSSPYKSKREKALYLIFNQAFKLEPQKIIEATEAAYPEHKGLYSPLKKVVLIDLPAKTAKITGHYIFQFAISMVVFYYVTRKCNDIYSMIQQGVGRALPVIINNTPVIALRAVNLALDIKDAAFNYKYRILFFTAVARVSVYFIPTIPYVSERIKAISLWKILQTLFFTGTETTIDFIKSVANNGYYFTQNQCRNFSGIFHNFAENNERQRLDEAKPKILKLWNQIVVDTAPPKPAEVE